MKGLLWSITHTWCSWAILRGSPGRRPRTLEPMTLLTFSMTHPYTRRWCLVVVPIIKHITCLIHPQIQELQSLYLRRGGGILLFFSDFGLCELAKKKKENENEKKRKKKGKNKIGGEKNIWPFSRVIRLHFSLGPHRHAQGVLAGPCAASPGGGETTRKSKMKPEYGIQL